MAKSQKPTPTKQQREWFEYCTDTRTGVAKALNDIRAGEVSEGDLARLQNFCMVALSLMREVQPQVWAQFSRKASLRSVMSGGSNEFLTFNGQYKPVVEEKFPHALSWPHIESFTDEELADLSVEEIAHTVGNQAWNAMSFLNYLNRRGIIKLDATGIRQGFADFAAHLTTTSLVNYEEPATAGNCTVLDPATQQPAESYPYATEVAK